MDAGEWYIEVNGRKVGPFTLDQVQGLLDDGEIRPYHQVTSVMTGGQWISVQDALEELRQPSTQAPPAGFPGTEPEPEAATQVFSRERPAGEFNPPPRPELDPTGLVDDPTDPALSLFDALQVVRERRATLQPPSVRPSTPKRPLFKMPNVAARIAAVKQVKISVPITPRMFWTAVFAGLVLGALTFGIMRAFKHHAPPPSGSLTPIHPMTRVEPPSEAHSYHRQLPPTIQRPVFTPPKSRTIPPPPPPAHVALPPRQNPNEPNENGEPARDEAPQQQDNAYPPNDNNGEPAGGQNLQNGDVQQGADGQPINPPGSGQNGQNPDGAENPNGAQNPPGNAPGQPTQPGQDQFQAVPPPPQQ